MKKVLFGILLSILSFSLKAQEFQFRENIDKDSLFNASIKQLPEDMREDYTNMYNEGNEQSKEFLLYMISLPTSSKKELIENYENRKTEIEKIKNEYQKLVPKNHIVYIEIEPESSIMTIPEKVTIKIYKKPSKKIIKTEDVSVQRADGLEVVSENWNMNLNSKELEKALNSLQWTNETLNQIKKLFSDANCISIQNGEITKIGFARSGMGKYSYNLFENNLSEKQKKEYDNGCEYIFYKDNVVLEYGGGAAGPQCFEQIN